MTTGLYYRLEITESGNLKTCNELDGLIGSYIRFLLDTERIVDLFCTESEFLQGVERLKYQLARRVIGFDFTITHRQVGSPSDRFKQIIVAWRYRNTGEAGTEIVTVG